MKTFFLTRSFADRSRGAGRNAGGNASRNARSSTNTRAEWPREAKSSPRKTQAVPASAGWERRELKGQTSEAGSPSFRIPVGARVRRGFSSERSSLPDRPSGSSPGTLEVIRCRGFQPGAQEARRADGTVQMRLPLGEWILALKTAQEIETEKSSC